MTGSIFYANPYFRLMRLHQPVGIVLLLWPCWWSIALASDGLPSFQLLLLFLGGAILMRSAGCIINDMADRKFDLQVERTKTRPLASGELSMRQATDLLVILISLSFCIALLLSPAVMLWAVIALVPVIIYPFMKRISWWPQLFLGLTFNWGALMGWAAVKGMAELPAFLLYAGGICWTLGYDTIYAHQDKKDDQRIGVKSLALRLGDKTRTFITAFYALAALLWLTAGYMAHISIPYYTLWVGICLHFGWQIMKVDFDSPPSCKKIFFSNAWLGAGIFAIFLAGKL